MRASMLLLCLVSASILGCGKKAKVAPVSGKVTMNGKALANATVSFQPNPPDGSPSVAAGSIATTNENGEFALKYTTGEDGAWVGTHLVRITLPQAETGSTDTRPPPGGWPKKETIPSRYSYESELTFEVPPGGTDKADFDLKSP